MEFEDFKRIVLDYKIEGYDLMKDLSCRDLYENALRRLYELRGKNMIEEEVRELSRIFHMGFHVGNFHGDLYSEEEVPLDDIL